MSNTINKIASIKELRIKNNTQAWFDNEIAEAIKTRYKHFSKFNELNFQLMIFKLTLGNI